MQHGRIIRITRPDGAIETYVVAVSDKAKAVATIKGRVAGKLDTVEPIGRASLYLLASMRLSAGQFAKG